MSKRPEDRRTLGLKEILLGPRPLPGGISGGPRPKGLLLFALPLPLLLAALTALATGRPSALLACGVGFTLFLIAAWLTRLGARDQERPRENRFNRSLRLSPKNAGGMLVGVATGFSALFAVGHGVATSAAFAVVALLAFHLLYGFQAPRRPVAIASDDKAQAKVVEAALRDAERHLSAIEHAADALSDRALRDSLGRIAEQGRGILRQIADKPGTLRRARKFLTVYLDGVREVTQGYAKTHQVADSAQLDRNFREVLTSIEGVFDEQRRKLLETDVLDLDVQIEVLKKQIEHEGLR